MTTKTGRVLAVWIIIAFSTRIGNQAVCQVPAEQQFSKLCEGCHGEHATGTDRGPSLVNSKSLRSRSEQNIHDLIRSGTQNGMPPFSLPPAQLHSLAAWIHSLNSSAFEAQPGGNITDGKAFFFGKGQCASCHMVAGQGGTNGPDLSDIAHQLTVRQIEQSLTDPDSRMGTHSTSACPSWAFCPEDTWTVVKVKTTDGPELRGFARGRGKHDLQLQTFDGRMHLLLDSEYSEVISEKASLMPSLKAKSTEYRDLLAYLSHLGGVPTGAIAGGTETGMAKDAPGPEGNWPTYNGSINGNRDSALKQINAANVKHLQLQWSYSFAYGALETTPLVSDGVMYVTGPNQVCALDSRTGRQIWSYLRPRSQSTKIAGDAAKGANRGAALAGDRVFFATDDAHLIALNRLTGGLMWDVVMPESPGGYGATGAPLVVNDLVIAGVAGGDAPLRGFIAAYHVSTGELAWRFWTVPTAKEPGPTWRGKALEMGGGGASWLTGSYDAATDLLYWPTGNPFPDTDGDQREGDNLYTNCVLALESKTGKLRWHFQFTPHDLHDWDATEPLVLVDAPFRGVTRKLLLQANRNGFFYVLDRTTGEFLLGEPFVKKLTWAKGLSKDGVPQLTEGNRTTRLGSKTCPAVRGATNWYSTAFNAQAGLFYLMAVEDCNIYHQAGSGGYEPYSDPSDPPEKYLRALDIQTGKVTWEVRQIGAPEANYSGVLSTAGSLVFYGETGGGFAAVDAKTGASLWHFETNQIWKASPMTYTINGRQYIAIASGGNILSFALPG